MIFEDFFKQATGVAPYGYQARLAHEGLPSVVQAPTGSGKTGAILAWLWRRLHGPQTAPRRPIYALPQPTLVEQVAGEVTSWLSQLGLADTVALHVVMGGEGHTQPQWRLHPHLPTIVVGTVDSLVSKALNRGYGISRSMYPIDFALVTNGAHWIIDEIQLGPESTTTLRQLAAFTQRHGTAEPFGLTCMSATVSDQLLGTVDNPAPGADEVLRIEPSERVGELAVRLGAQRTIRRLPVESGDYKAIAVAVLERHQAGSLTLVVVNTVSAARGVYSALAGNTIPRTLLHSRFRGIDRQQLVQQLLTPSGEAGHIVVSTQVVEAGVDINATTMITEAAPWPSLVQRSGRCNRTGQVRDAGLWWLKPAKPEPYEADDINATAAALTALEGVSVTGEDLLARAVATIEPEVAVLRRPDILTLFDTGPDLTGADLDVSPYVRDAEDLDVQLAWATWTSSHEDGRPPDNAKAPVLQWRCRVPLGELRAMLKRVTVWRFDQALGRWSKINSSGQPARPGEVLVVHATEGGYDPQTGLNVAARKTVPDSPSLDEPAAAGTDPAAGAEDGYRQDDGSVAQLRWVTLAEHSNDARRHAEALLTATHPQLPVGVAEAVVLAAYSHDTGKCHEIWQEALCKLAPTQEQPQRRADGPWAKSAERGRLYYRGGTAFRHELVSMLLLDGPLRGLLADVEDPELVRYLVLAHHGKLRVQVREPDNAADRSMDDKQLLGLRAGEMITVDDLLGHSGDLIVDLDQFTLGGDRSWTRTALELRDRYGPFLLAYLEMLVRIADWRASAELEEAR